MEEGCCDGGGGSGGAAAELGEGAGEGRVVRFSGFFFSFLLRLFFFSTRRGARADRCSSCETRAVGMVTGDVEKQKAGNLKAEKAEWTKG